MNHFGCDQRVQHWHLEQDHCFQALRFHFLGIQLCYYWVNLHRRGFALGTTDLVLENLGIQLGHLPGWCAQAED